LFDGAINQTRAGWSAGDVTVVVAALIALHAPRDSPPNRVCSARYIRDLIDNGETADNRRHAGTIRVLHTLRPFAVAMAGAGEFDSFKD
jgi:hypothetical protein